MVIEKENFLSIEECDELIKESSSHFFRTTTLGKEIDGYRVAEGAWLSNSLDIVKNLKQKVNEESGIPISNMEGTHIVKYEIGGEYKVHHDFFHPNESYFPNEMKRGGQRLKTALVYLNDEFTGGETEFPKMSIKVKPKKGKLVLWDNTNPDGSPDYESLHAGLPVESGTKYIAVVWIRESTFF
jgi:prolyl 4-hydroxylase